MHLPVGDLMQESTPVSPVNIRKETMPKLRLPILFVLATLLFACGGGEDPEPGNNAKTPEDMGMLDMAQTSEPVDMGKEEVDEGPPAPQCTEPEVACGQTCVDTQTDIENCGECGNACGRSTACVDGECICFMTGRTWCGAGVCVDTANDAKNCGECGNVCPAANYCDRGECVDDGFIGEVVLLTNEARKVARDCGGDYMDAVGPLSVNDKLALAAQRHAEDMEERDFFAHDNPDGATPRDRMRAAGYTGSVTGENIAQGQNSPAEVVQAWIDSPGHCRNMMSPGYTEIGVGFHKGSREQWVQNFGAP